MVVTHSTFLPQPTLTQIKNRKDNFKTPREIVSIRVAAFEVNDRIEIEDSKMSHLKK